MAPPPTATMCQWLMWGEHHRATRAGISSSAFFFFSFLFFLLISSFAVQSPRSYVAQRHPPRLHNNPDHDTTWRDNAHCGHATTAPVTQNAATQQPRPRHNTVRRHPLQPRNKCDRDTKHGHTTTPTATQHGTTTPTAATKQTRPQHNTHHGHAMIAAATQNVAR
jgi:hypothetical protein